MSQRIPYRPEIDGLRAIAIVPVILYHAGVDSFSGGFVGVDVFFVISGYLITSILIADVREGTFSLASFYKRRARRLLPALFVVLATCVPFAWLWLPDSEMQDFSQSVVAAVFFGSNMLFWGEAGYFESDSAAKPLLHTWSLGVEEQFYLIFPILFLLVWRLGQRWLASVIASLGVMSMVFSEWILTIDPAASFFLLPSRFWELALGSLAALFLGRFPLQAKDRVWPELASWVGIGLIAFGVATFDGSTPFPGLAALIPAGGALLVILFAQVGGPLAKLLGSKILVGVGLVSYSAYLWHNPIFVFAKRFSPEGFGLGTIVILMALTGVLAYATWKWIETPYRNSQKTSTRKSIGVALASITVLAALGLWGHLTEGFRATAQNVADSPPGEVLTTKNFIVVGDSHAEHLIFGLQESTSGEVMDFTSPGCLPLRDVDRYDSRFVKGACAEKMNTYLDYILTEDPNAVVVLSAMGPVYLDGTPFKGVDPARVEGLGVELITDKTITDRWRVYQIGLDSTFRELSKMRNTDVVFFIDVPELGEDYGCRVSQKAINFGLFILRDAVPPTSDEDCRISRDVYNERTDRYRTLVSSVANNFPSIRIFDPTEIFCDESFCTGINEDGQRLYRDADHLSKVGSLTVAKAVIASLW